jgi:hypothetical protein
MDARRWPVNIPRVSLRSVAASRSLSGVDISFASDKDKVSVERYFLMAQRVREKKWIDDKKTDTITRLSFIIIVFVHVIMVVAGCGYMENTHTDWSTGTRLQLSASAQREQNYQRVYGHDFSFDFLD